VRRLVLAGAPVDIAAGQSQLSQMTVQLPLAAFEEFVGSQGGRVLQIWGTALIADDSRRVLQLAPEDNSRVAEELQCRFEEWYDLTVDLPGTYYLQVVSWLYQQNRLATGNFVALGRKINLARLYHPIFLLGARDDEVVAPEQLFATANRVGTPKERVVTVAEAPGRGSRAGCARSSGLRSVIPALMPFVVLAQRIFTRSIKRSQAAAEFKKQLDLAVTLILVFIGCAVAYSLAEGPIEEEHIRWPRPNRRIFSKPAGACCLAWHRRPVSDKLALPGYWLSEAHRHHVE
jgi:hypothetical protein